MTTTRRHQAGALVLASALLIGAQARADEGSQRPPRLSALGAEAGELTLAAAGGLIFALPWGDASARLGLGGGASLQVEAELIALAGWSGSARLAWGSPALGDLAIGVEAWTSRASLSRLNGFAGAEFQNLAFGNDWTAGGGLLLTVLRARGAHLTFGAGLSATIGGVRYLDFDSTAFQYDPGLRNVHASALGEWPLTETVSLLIGLQGIFPLHTELQPIGFLPTATAGVAWAIF